MMRHAATSPHPALRAALSRKGRGLARGNLRFLPSPLAGEGGRRRRPGEGGATLAGPAAIASGNHPASPARHATHP
jgi:hypothetical protein